MNLKIGKRVAFTSRKTAGIGKITDLYAGETGEWVEITGKVTRTRPRTTGDDWSDLPSPRAVTARVRPSQVSAP